MPSTVEEVERTMGDWRRFKQGGGGGSGGGGAGGEAGRRVGKDRALRLRALGPAAFGVLICCWRCSEACRPQRNTLPRLACRLVFQAGFETPAGFVPKTWQAAGLLGKRSSGAKCAAPRAPLLCCRADGALRHKGSGGEALPAGRQRAGAQHQVPAHAQIVQVLLRQAAA